MAEPDTAARRITSLLRLLGLETERYVESVGDAHTMGRNDVRAIGVVKAAQTLGEPVNPTLLAHDLGLSAPATSALIDRLVRAEHVVRRQSDRDARRVELRTTASANG